MEKRAKHKTTQQWSNSFWIYLTPKNFVIRVSEIVDDDKSDYKSEVANETFP